jgi:hypothetical protein
MARIKKSEDPRLQIAMLLRKSLALRLFELSVPQADIAKKLRVDIRFVNDFLKGIRKPNGKGKKEEG